MTFENSLLTEDDWLSLATPNYEVSAKRKLDHNQNKPVNSYGQDYANHKRHKDDSLPAALFAAKNGRGPTVGELTGRSSLHVYDALAFNSTADANSYFSPDRPGPRTPPGSTMGSVPASLSNTVPSPPLTDDANLNAAALNVMAEKYMYFYGHSNPSCELYDSQGKPVSIRLVSKLRGNWHLTLSSISPESAQDSQQAVGASESKQLTFYRRNLFSLDCTLVASGIPSNIISPEHPSPPGTTSTALRERLHIAKFTIGLELLSSTKRKRQADLVDRHGSPVTELDVDFHKTLDDSPADESCRSSYEWEKIKFSSATINNGAPNQQPYFEVGTVLTAVTTSGERIVVARATSRPIIVRGRHPRFYKDRFGISLNGEGASRRSSQVSSSLAPASANHLPPPAIVYGAGPTDGTEFQHETPSSTDHGFGRTQPFYSGPGVANFDQGDDRVPPNAYRLPAVGRPVRHSYEYFPLDQESGKGPLSYGYYYPHLGHLAGSDNFQAGQNIAHRHFYKPLEFVE